jgi:DNA-binding MarR family transcriptional regulator
MEHLPSWLLTQSAAHAHRLVTERFAEVGARGYHYRLLAPLLDGPASQADLGRRAGIHFGDVVAVLNELAEGGYVERRPDPDDRRRNVVTITDRGRERCAELAATAAAIQDELLAPLTAAERTELVRLLSLLRRGAAAD